MTDCPSSLRILVIRRDNIGDLACTTPIFTALRTHFPKALICALVNSYNAPVVANNPDIDRVFAYTKLKHREKGQSRLRLLWQRMQMQRALKRASFDYVLLPSSQARLLRFAKSLRPGRIIALGEPLASSGKVTLLPAVHVDAEHEVQTVFRLLSPLGINDTPPALTLVPDRAESDKALTALNGIPGSGPIISLHISARKPSQRWPSDRFVLLMHTLHARYGIRFMLLWSPGSATNRMHPGDDEKADLIMANSHGLPVLAYPTRTLPELIGALSCCNALICSDGGAMHLAAGLGKPIVCLFGKSDARRWHPWGVPYRLLQPGSKDVEDITVEDVATAFDALGASIAAN